MSSSSDPRSAADANTTSNPRATSDPRTTSAADDVGAVPDRSTARDRTDGAPTGHDRVDHHDRTEQMSVVTDRREPTTVGRREVVAAQKERFGGIKWGSAFFGWLTATGSAVLLIGLAAALGAVVGFADPATGAGGLVDQAGRVAQDPGAATGIGVTGAIVVLVVLFVAYYCGGYVAGRMARFNGLRQGLAVWVWAVVIALAVAVLGALAGARFDVLAAINSLPRIPINEGALTTGAVVSAVVAVVASLIGALLGGLAGMRFHRSVDRAGFDRQETTPHP